MYGLARKTFPGAICGVVESLCGVVELRGEQQGLAFYAPYTTYYMPTGRKNTSHFCASGRGSAPPALSAAN